MNDDNQFLLTSEAEANAAEASSNLTNESIANQATTLRHYLASSYDCDITILRCPKTGKPYYRIDDRELVAIFDCAGSDLVRFAERMEQVVRYPAVNPAWLVSDDESLERLCASQPVEFFNFAISNLIGINSFYQSLRKSGTGALTNDGKFLFNSAAFAFAERSYRYWAHASREQVAQLADLNQKLILALAIDASDKIEKLINQELSFEWVAQELESGNLLAALTKSINQILNSYRLKHNLALADRLTVADIEKIARQRIAESRASERKHSEALRAYRDSQANQFRQLKKAKARNPYLETLVSELMLANNDKEDYLNQLTMRKAQLLDSNKPFTHLDKLAKAARQGVAQPKLKVVTINFSRLAKPVEQPEPRIVDEPINASEANSAANREPRATEASQVEPTSSTSINTLEEIY